MKKLYYILILSAQHFISLSKCWKTIKNEKTSSNNSLDNGTVVERSKNVENPWKNFMKKFDIEKNHGSGVRVDLGEDAEVKHKTYRLPAGQCPVFGKGITIVNSTKSFLDPVATGENKIKSGGFAFPEATEKISPLSIDVLRSQYKDVQELRGLNDISLCAKHASSFRLSSDANSEYRHSAVYDTNNNMCYILYISAQENMGPRYCDKNASNEDTMFCFKPEKSEKFQSLAYLSKNLRNDWEEYCPHKNLGDSKFGLWVDGNCEEIPTTVSFEAESLLECNQIVFEASPSDQPKIYEEELSDYEKLIKGAKDNNAEMIGNVFFPKGAFKTDKYKSKGVGFNWGNYNKETKECQIFNVKPTCLINHKNFIATTALSHPTEVENTFPCDIYKKAIEKEVKQQAKHMELHTNERIIFPRIFISDDIENLNCPCNPEEVSNTTCRYFVCKCIERMEEITENNVVKTKDEYLEKSSIEGDGNKKMIVIIAIIVGIGLLAAAFFIYFFRKKKSDEKYERMEQADTYGKSNSRKDELLDPEASFWGEEKRGSHTTPVLMEKPYY
ncbi:apical membrane antigen 1, putative [Plasmodium gallinaceum]|uniref:Apical membrane antigen 1 n=1 Tax=Plasmodium gallinaceum TaxID=5849 RepID=A0A097F754_PLAGA|nr:apical membrane antigen 1, putative [Plasmodium gallinaceum]AIT18314.1 apical membrane antigen 1 [Plasmodium gallinaceum]CRG96385.1 apical membrane antigen 1, putative [Plasmodium gallinaceum]